MLCPHDVGRENWGWEEQEALCVVASPHKVGEEALAEWSPFVGRKTERPWCKMVVVVVVEDYIFLINIIVGTPGP